MTREQFWKFIGTGIPTYDEIDEEFEDDPIAFKKKYDADYPDEAYGKVQSDIIAERIAPYAHYPVTEDFSKKSGIKSWGQLKGKQVLPDFYNIHADDGNLEDINDFVNDTSTVDYWAPAFEKFGNVNAIGTALYSDDSDDSMLDTYNPDNLDLPAAVFATDDPDWEKTLMKNAKKWQMDAAIRKAMKQQETITDAVQDWK